MEDEFAWQPRWGFAHRRLSISGRYDTACDGVGVLYLPLVRLDQRFVHPTLRVLTADMKFDEDAIRRATPLHPRERARA